jgi:molecular chaperone HtpG
LSGENIEVEAKSLATDALPGVIVIDEQQRRMRDYMLHLDPKDIEGKMKIFDKRTFIVNTNNPLIASLQKINTVDSELAREMVQQAYELALLSQREMDPVSLNVFITRCNHIMERMAQLLSQKGSS